MLLFFILYIKWNNFGFGHWVRQKKRHVKEVSLSFRKTIKSTFSYI